MWWLLACSTRVPPVAASDAAGLDLGPLAALGASLDAGLRAFVAGAPLVESFPDQTAVRTLEDEMTLRSSLKQKGVTMELGAMEFELLLGAWNGAGYSVRTTYDPGIHSFLDLSVQAGEGVGLVSPIDHYAGSLLPIAEAGQSLARSLQGPSCAELPVGVDATTFRRYGIPEDRLEEVITGTQAELAASCAELAGKALPLVGIRLDDLTWLLRDEEGALVGMLKGELEVGPGELVVGVGDLPRWR